MARMAGIDVGSASVKVVLYEGSLRRFQFKGAYSRPVPQDAEAAPDEAGRDAALRGLLADILPDDEPNVLVMGFPAEHASARLVTLPFSDRGQVERALPFEVEGQVPFDLEDVVLASRIVDMKPGQTRVLTVLADKARVGEHLAGLEGAGINPRHLVLDADLLGHYATRGVQAVVDMGHTRTLVALCQDGHVIGARALVGGGRDLTLALCRVFELSWEVAQTHKHALSLSPSLSALAWEDDEDTSPIPTGQEAPVRQLAEGARPRDVQTDGPRVLREALSPLLTDLRATLIAFEDSTDVEIDEVLVCGGAAELGGLLDLLRENLGVIVRPVLAMDEEEDPRKVGALALALGRRSVEGARERELDLRQGAFAFKGDLTAYTSYAAYGAAGLLGLAVLAVFYWGWQTWQIAGERREIEERIAAIVLETWPDAADPSRLADTSTAMAIAVERAAAEAAQVEALSGAVSDVPPTLDLLRELSDAMPPPGDARVDVTELSILDSSITLKIDTDGFESATRIENSLKERPNFAAAQGGDSKKVGEIVRFTVTIPLGPEGAAGEEG